MTLSIFANQNTWHLIELFLWMLGAFLIGWFFWRWWYQDKYKNEIQEWKSKYEEMENELNSTIKVKKVAAPGVIMATTANFVDGVAKVDDSVIDDLKMIEGIGPKIQELLNNDSIFSFKQLSETRISQLKNILEAAGSRYKMHVPDSWPEQARLAYEDKWDELKELQDNLKGGRKK